MSAPSTRREVLFTQNCFYTPGFLHNIYDIDDVHYIQYLRYIHTRPFAIFYFCRFFSTAKTIRSPKNLRPAGDCASATSLRIFATIPHRISCRAYRDSIIRTALRYVRRIMVGFWAAAREGDNSRYGAAAQLLPN